MFPEDPGSPFRQTTVSPCAVGFTGSPITDSRALTVSHTEQTFVLTVHNDEHVYLAHFAII